MLKIPLYQLSDLEQPLVNTKGDIGVMLLNGNEEQQAFVKAIFQAAKIDVIQRVAFYPTNEGQVKFHHIKSNQPLSCFISFGVVPKTLGLQIDVQPYTIYQLDGVHLLFVDSVDAFLEEKNTNKNRPLAKMLWGAIKMMFEI